MTHTALPWVVVTTRLASDDPQLFHWREIVREGEIGEDDTVIAEVYVETSQPHPDDETAAANAELIVRAVNSHDELVAAALAVLERADDLDFVPLPELEALRAAVRKARGEQGS